MNVELEPEAWWRLMASIRNGEPLPQPAREWLIELLELVRQGEDPRKFAGTMPAIGRPEKPRALLSMHYWMLRKIGVKDAAALKEVSEKWHLSEGQVKKVKAKNRPHVWPSIDRMTADQLEMLIADIESFLKDGP